MAATIINYLYEDLPEGHTVLASEWNDAMQLIKETVNTHAELISQQAKPPYELNIGSTLAPWDTYDEGYNYTLTQQLHNKGTRPQVTAYTTAGDEILLDLKIDLDTGDITFYSNAPEVIKVIIR